jgi:hypothetical protein
MSMRSSLFSGFADGLGRCLFQKQGQALSLGEIVAEAIPQCKMTLIGMVKPDFGWMLACTQFRVWVLSAVTR